MDFMSNILKKAPFKSESSEDREKPEEDTQSETEKKQEPNKPGIGAGLVDGMQSFMKSTFKGSSNREPSEATESEEQDDESKKESTTSSIGSGLMNTVLKTTSFFKSDANNDSKRKGSSDTQSETEPKEDSATASSPGGDDASGDKSTPSEQVSNKAIDSAKSIGNFLFNVANKAGQTVTATATKLKQSVEHNSLLADFTKEQQEFIKEHGGNIEVGEPPWVGCEQEEEVKQQIISLSTDKRNFVRSPPSGVQFDFDMQQMLPVALALLKHDSNLEKMRFELVPALVNEETFWRNYFYRVSLIKQSTSLSNLNKGVKGWASSSSSSAEGPDEPSPTNPEPEFISDSIQGSVSEEDLKSGMRQLGIGRSSGSKDRSDSTSAQDDKRWEEEINKDLQEFEVVGKDDNNGLDEDLEKDLAQL